MMSHHKKGYYRDQKIVALVENRYCLTTDQLRILVFREYEHVDMCYRRLRILSGNVKQKKKRPPQINRDRLSMSEPFFYWPSRKDRPDQIEHRIGVNWLFVWFTTWAKRTGAEMNFRGEPKEYEPTVRPDAFTSFRTTNKSHLYFGEFHRHESGNEFDKLPKYTALFNDIITQKQHGIRPYPWVELRDQRIPTLTVVTTGPKQPILECLVNQNPLGIPYELLTLEELKERCVQWVQQ